MSMFTVSFRGKVNVIRFEITIDDSIEEDRFYFGTTKEETIYGNDQDLDTIIYPGSVAFEFTLAPKQVSMGFPNPFGDPETNPYANFGIPEGADVEDEYFKLISSLSFKTTIAKMFKNDVEVMRGYVQPNNIGTDYSRKAIKINVISDFVKIKELDPRSLSTAAYQSAPNEGKILFTDLVLKLIQEVYPLVDNVALMTDIKTRTGVNFLGQPYDSPAQYLGDWNYYYVGSTGNYQRASDIIRDVCFMFGAVALVIGNTLYITSRSYFSDTTITLSKRRYYKGQGPSLLSAQRMDALRLLISRYPMTANDSSLYEYIYGTVIKTISFDSKAGSSFMIGETVTWSGGSAEILWVEESGGGGTMRIKLTGENRYPADNLQLTGLTSGGTANVNGFYHDIENSDNVETIRSSGVGGDPPGIDGTVYPLLVQNMFVYLPAFVVGIGNDRWESTGRNSFFYTGGSLMPLWKCVGDKIWDLIKDDRLVFVQKLPGENWAYNCFYKYDINAFKFRPRKIYYNELESTTKIELIKC